MRDFCMTAGGPSQRSELPTALENDEKSVRLTYLKFSWKPKHSESPRFNSLKEKSLKYPSVMPCATPLTSVLHWR